MAEYDENTGTTAQTEFMRDVIKSLLKGSNVNTASMSQPGGWYHSVSDLLGTVAGTALTQKVNQQEDERYAAGSGLKSKGSKPKPGYSGLPPPSKVGMIDPSGATTGGTGIETASTGQPIGQLSSDIYNGFVNEVKKSENSPLFEGKINKSKAEWDYKQHSIGYGTRSKPGEVIDKDEAERRFGNEWGKAEKVVDAFKPGLDPGTRAALTSLTFNAGPGWTQGGLGKAVTSGNMDEAKRIFSKYYIAGGKPNEGLRARRQREAQWFGQGKDDMQTASTSPNAAKDEDALRFRGNSSRLRDIAAQGVALPDAQAPTQGGPPGATAANTVPAAAAPANTPVAGAPPAATAADAAEKEQLAQAAAQKGPPGGPPAALGPPAKAPAVAGSEQRLTTGGNPFEAVLPVDPKRPGVVNVPGYGQTGIPPLPPLPSRQQISAQARVSKDPNKVWMDYMEMAKGVTQDTPTGQLHIAPTELDGPHKGQPIVTFTPTKGPFETGKVLPDIKGGQGGMGITAPGRNEGGKGDLTEGLAGLSEWNKFDAKLKGEHAAIVNTEEARAKRFVDLEHDVIERAQGAADTKGRLNIAKSLIEHPGFYSGSGSNIILNIKKMGATISGNPNWSGSSEAFAKLLAGANIQGLQAFKGYGQIRNPEIKLLEDSMGTLTNTPGALRAIIDMNMRAADRLVDIQNRMLAYRKEHGKLDTGFDEEMKDYYSKHPLYTDREIANYRDQFKSPKDKAKQEELRDTYIPGVGWGAK